MAFNILKRDLLALLKNPIALIVVGALLVLPGLYAWYCIIANWDPYANTSRMPIAVVNYDEGAHNNLAGDINIGKQVVEKLEDNESIDWRFFDSKEEALEETRTGGVYATLVLPEDLSKNLVGIFEGSSEKPTIYYYPNEKYNAVATKVTDSAAQTLIREINQGFSSTVNQKVLESSQGIANDVENRADSTKTSAVNDIKAIQDDLYAVVASLDDASNSIEGWRAATNDASFALAATQDQLPAVQLLLQQAGEEVNSLRTSTSSFESELSATIMDSASTVSELSSKTVATLAQAKADLEAVRADVRALINAIGSDIGFEDLVEELKLLQAIDDLITDIINRIDERIETMNATVQDITNTVKSATGQINTQVMLRLNTGANDLSSSLFELASAVAQFEPQMAGLLNVLGQTDSILETTATSIADAKTLLSTIAKNLRNTTNDISTIGSALQIDQLSKIMNIEPNNMGTFISSPVQMVTEKIYPVSNYGTAVAPFYTNLALWVGCFILVSLMKVEVTGSGVEGATRRERYFGRWLLFVILSLLQSQVICGVDILLGIDCANPVAFMAMGAVCSFAYMNLIFALVKTFRNIGKTLCIFLLIMQVPGSSGMYPIEIMPGFFQAVHPALPFTYGIDAMREALCGMNGSDYFIDMVIMLTIVPVSLLIGLGLRPAMANILSLFDEEMNKTGFFASEEYVPGAEPEDRMRGVFRALVAHGAYADDIEMRAFKFNRLYPRRRRIGSIVTIVIPFVFLVIMLPLNMTMNLSTDTKLNALMIMLIVLAIALLALVVLEYMHRVIEEEMRMLGASIMGDDFDVDLTPADDEPLSSVFSKQGMVPATAAMGARAPHGGPTSDIFTTDLALGFRSVVGVVVIVLLVITPSMYAWFNIAGSWDPYSSTGNLKVAVANEDHGYKGDLVPITINVGDTLVSQLRGNSNFDWVFVSKDEAVSGVKDARYYAAIEIPEDFTENLLTYLTENADYPEVYYYTNQKENPIAPIITQKGANAIQENIRVSFTERVDEVVLSVAYDLLGYLSNPDMSSYVSTMSRHLDDATHDTKSASGQMSALAGLLNTVASVVDTAGTTIDGIKATGDTAEVGIEEAKAGATSAAAALDEAMEIVRSLLDGRTIDVTKIQQIIDTVLDLLELGADTVPGQIQDVIDVLERHAPGESASAEVKARYQALIDELKTAKQHADAVPGDVANARTELDGLIQTAQNEVTEAKAYFEGTLAQSLGELRATLGSLATSTSDIVGGVKGSLSGLGNSTGGLSSQLSSLSGGLTKASDKLNKAATSIEETKARVAEALKSGDLQQIKDVILGGDPEILAASLAAPIEEYREPLYPVANFGSAMASFYTVLSLWVGALVMISTMRVHVVEERLAQLRERYGRLRPRHEFFGRYGLFGLIGFMQSALVLLGDLMLLHIQCDNPVLFFLFGLFVGQMFCLIVYTITELFGDVGKALCVILLIMQVAASGGTFPAEMLDPLLYNVVPFLPFYHAMTLLQECVAGVLWPRAIISIVALLVMAGAMLILGLPLRRPFRKLNNFFEEQLEKTGYM